MDHLIRGAADFNRDSGDELRAEFRRLAKEGQSPSVLLITCVDSRVLPTLVTNSPPGGILILRNVGNLVPMPGVVATGGDASVSATVEFALEYQGIPDIVLMGHSSCGGMAALLAKQPSSDSLGRWLQHGRPALEKFATSQFANEELAEADRLSQLNVLAGLEALSLFPAVRERLARGGVNLHGWWFDIAAAKLLAHDPRAERFLPVEQVYEAARSTMPNP